MIAMNHRLEQSKRCFTSPVIEQAIQRVTRRIADPELAALFGNCFPNTLDTTVIVADDDGCKPDTFVITGDIDAMWLRDSTNQVWPYLRFVDQDETLKRLIQGVINRQARCVLVDPYANAFNREPRASHWMSDFTAMTEDLHERKYELDSLCAVIRLSYGYYQASEDLSCFDAAWQSAMRRIVATIRTEQSGADEIAKDDYRFQRMSPNPTETLACGGYGQPARRCGLSKSPFRPSDDAAMLPFLIPANAMAVVCLRNLGVLWQLCDQPGDAMEALTLAEEIDAAIRAHAVIRHRECGEILAYEVDGYGSHYCMDDANVPSLLSLPYLGYCAPGDPLYASTRRFVLSDANPYYAQGKAAKGVGSPHTGRGTIWPMSITMRALTSDSDDEIVECLEMLCRTHAGTGFMHESFHKDDAASYTRDWFAWANTLFGELILTLDAERPHILENFRAR